jgi:ribA/ribD-fused uncharacterized protein
MFICNFTINGIIFHSSEQFYMFSKCSNESYQKLILNETNPLKCKSLSKKLLKNTFKINSNFHDNKLTIMKLAVTEKFRQNNGLALKLLNTPDSILIETNNWGDTFWGIDIYSGFGEDNLGKILRETKKNLCSNNLI